MGKTVASKRRGASSLHSRAARRETSPGIDTDKSLKSIRPPPETSYHPLGVHAGAGVTKKGRKAILSAKAKRRQERSLDRAEVVMDKLQKKVEKSKDRAKTVQVRRRGWDEQNKQQSLHQAMITALPVEYGEEGDDANDYDTSAHGASAEVVERSMNDATGLQQALEERHLSASESALADASLEDEIL